MSLKHDEGYNIPFDSPFYPLLPAVFRNVKFQFVFFYSSPEAVAKFLPEPLDPSEEGLVVACGLDIPYCSHYGPFLESFISLKCRFQGKPGYYLSHMFHNGPAGIAAGREIYGTPKVWAELRVRQVERTVLTETFLAGVPVLQISSTMIEVGGKDTMPALTPSWRLKIIPRADGPGPALKQLIDCAITTQDITLHYHAKGQGRVALGASPMCDLTPLTPVRYGEAYYRELSYSEGYAEIAYDYLQPAK